MSYQLRTPTLVYEVIPDHFDRGSGTAPLRAIRARLDHLASLSIDALALTPIFPSPDTLRLHTREFDVVDPALGTTADFTDLCVAAAERGISVVLMGVFDHVSLDSPWFAWAEAQGDDDSRYPPEHRTRKFFTFGPEHRHGYACRDDSPDEPELDLANPEVRRRLFTGEDSVLHRWLHAGARGWRILRAEQVGYSILRELARGSRTVEGSHFIVGDIKGFADRYVRDGLLDGVVNHYAREAVISYLRGQVPARQLARVYTDLRDAYEKALPRCWNVLSGYDMPRLSTLLGEPSRVRLATLLSYTLPGAGHVFYGEEVGVGLRGPGGAVAMSWETSTWDLEVLAFHRALGLLRRERAALRSGDFCDLTPEGEDEIFSFARVTADPRETVIVAMNRASQTRVRKLFAPVADLPDGLKLADALGGPGAVVRSGTVTLEIMGQDARILVPDDRDPASARFFRGY